MMITLRKEMIDRLFDSFDVLLLLLSVVCFVYGVVVALFFVSRDFLLNVFKIFFFFAGRSVRELGFFSNEAGSGS